MPRAPAPLLSALFVTCAALTVLAPRARAVTPAPGSNARILPISPDAFAGSAVNVIAQLQNTLFTAGEMQFAAFYAADGTVVLARRPLGADTWETRRTVHRGDVADAHKTIALAVDGAGYLHVSWDHHMDPLRYARSVASGSLELGPKQSMIGALENKVTYPAFLRLPGGDLLFLYRDGVSGQGNIVLNRYRTAERRWTRVHANLLDGQGRRSAYIATAIDALGTLHLAWNWRETPDVATNHDLCYARSVDGGGTWTTTAGAPLALPINAATAEYALRIPEGSTLINSFSLAADDAGHPYLANYWCPPGSAIPQYHLVRHDGHAWHVSPITRRTTPFELKGTSTRRPPLSRSLIFIESPAPPAAPVPEPTSATVPTSDSAPAHAYVIYRDDERGGRVTLAATADADAPQPTWTFTALTADAVGAWEPSADPVQWPRFRQIHLLVQAVEQRDGNDRHPVPVLPGPIGSLIWRSPASVSAAAP